jgi:hypothetical protein
VVYFLFNYLRREVVVCFVDTGRIVDHHYLNFLIIIDVNFETTDIVWLISVVLM